MNSVERLVEYSTFTTEAPAVIEGHRPPAGWPAQGSIVVRNLVVRYGPHLDPVLRGLTFEVQPRMKVRLADGDVVCVCVCVCVVYAHKPYHVLSPRHQRDCLID